MWLKQLLSYLRFKYLLHTQRDLPVRQPNRPACEAWVHELRSEYFRQYVATIGMHTKIQTPYPSIETYTKIMRELARLIKEEKPLSPDWCTGQEFEMSFDRFLISTDGCYLNTEDAVSKFKEAALKLCHAMRPADTATHGVYEHNLRMLTKLFINLRVLTREMVKVSLTNE